MTKFEKPSNKLSRNLFPVCLKCSNCRQYNSAGGFTSIYCQKQNRNETWPLDDENNCPKFKIRKTPSDPIAMEDSALRILLLDLMSTIACTLINEEVSSQSVGSIKRSLAASEPLLGASRVNAAEVVLLPKLGRSEVVPSVEKALELLEPLKEGSFISSDLRVQIANAGEELERLYHL